MLSKALKTSKEVHTEVLVVHQMEVLVELQAEVRRESDRPSAACSPVRTSTA